jgi:hypothetical protein
MLQTFNIVAYRADTLELALLPQEQFSITQEYRFPERSRHHPVTGTTTIPASGPYFPPRSLRIPVRDNGQFLAAAEATFRQNRYGDFRLLTDGGREIVATIREIKSEFSNAVTLTVDLSL